jgi:prophage maintenance system killer protein
MAEPRWVPAEEIAALNEAEVAESGGTALADLEAVKRALGDVQRRWTIDGERDAVRLAVAHLTAIMAVRPFAARNRATGLAALVLFLEANGYRWAGPDGPVLAAYVKALADGRYTEEGLAETMRPDIFPA